MGQKGREKGDTCSRYTIVQLNRLYSICMCASFLLTTVIIFESTATKLHVTNGIEKIGFEEPEKYTTPINDFLHSGCRETSVTLTQVTQKT